MQHHYMQRGFFRYFAGWRINDAAPSRLLATLLILIYSFACPTPAFAKVRLIIVYPLRSSVALASEAAVVTKRIAERIASIPGFDTQILPAPATGSLGASAASAGAEVYVVGMLASDQSGSSLLISSFSAANDVLKTSYEARLSESFDLPPEADLSSLVAPAPPTSGAAPVTMISGLTLGTPIPILLDSPISSNAASVGQTFSFHAARDVYSADSAHISIVKGAPGFGEVQTVDAAGGNGHGGKISLQFNWIVASDGTKIPLTNAQSSTEGGDSKGASSTATIATYVLLGPLGLFAHNFVRGKDAQITTTTTLTAYVDREARTVPTTLLQPAVTATPSP